MPEGNKNGKMLLSIVINGDFSKFLKYIEWPKSKSNEVHPRQQCPKREKPICL